MLHTIDMAERKKQLIIMRERCFPNISNHSILVIIPH